ncbi:MAG: AAA family ATPase [Candidatus Caldarchaeum sp.]
MKRILLMGEPGSGKTYAVGNTYPTPILLLNFDRGGWESIIKRSVRLISRTELEQIMSGKQPPPAQVCVRNYLPSRTVISLALFRDPQPEVASDFIKDLNLVMVPSCPFKTICIDPYTRMDEAIMDFILGMQGKKTPEIQHYKFQQDKKHEVLTSILAAAEGMPNLEALVVTAHTETTKVEGHGLRILPSGVGAKYQEVVGSLFSHVLYATTETTGSGKLRYVVWTQPRSFVYGLKTRGQELPPVVDNTWEALAGKEVNNAKP